MFINDESLALKFLTDIASSSSQCCSTAPSINSDVPTSPSICDSDDEASVARSFNSQSSDSHDDVMLKADLDTALLKIAFLEDKLLELSRAHLDATSISCQTDTYIDMIPDEIDWFDSSPSAVAPDAVGQLVVSAIAWAPTQATAYMASSVLPDKVGLEM